VIVVDTTILALAVGAEHELREPVRRLVRAAASRAIEATTTTEVIQEFAHIRGRRHGRDDAARLARRFAELLSPLIVVEAHHLDRGLRLFEEHPELGAFDAVLAATALGHEAAALVSADADFRVLRGLPHVEPGTRAFEELLAQR